MSGVLPTLDAQQLASKKAQNTFDAAPADTSSKTLWRPPGSCLSMTAEQWQKLVDYVCDEIEKWQGIKEKHGWDRLRDEYIHQHEDEFAWRETAGSIFADSNISFNQSRRNTLPIVARLTKDYFGIDDFYAVEPTRLNNEELAPKIQRYSKYKLGSSNMRDSMIEGVDRAAVVGERVLKITHIEDATFYKETAVVLMAGDKPMRTSKGDVIYADDQWVLPQAGPDDIATVQEILAKVWPYAPSFVKTLLQAAFPAQTQEVLKKDPTVIKPEGRLNFQKATYPMKYVKYSGPSVEGIHHKDFICPLNASDVQKAKFCAHLYDADVDDTVERFVLPYEAADLDVEERAFFSNLLDKVNLLKNADDRPKSAATQAKEHHAEGEVSAETQDPFHGITQRAEAYVTGDFDGDGVVEEIALTVDLKNRFAYTADYTPNFVPPAVGRPFRVFRITPAVDRWYGISEYKINGHKQHFIDWCLNRLVWDMSIAGQVRGYNPKAAREWEREPPKPGDKLYTFDKADEFEKGIITIEMPTLNDQTFKLLQTMMQSSQADRGNLAPGGDSISQLPSSKLKYGIEAIQRSGDELYALSAILLRPCIESTVFAALQTMLAHMDEIEEYEYTEGDRTLSDTINRSELEDLKFNVKLDLTLARGDQIVQTNQAAMQMVMTYMQTPAFIQVAIRPFILAQMRAMEIQCAEKSLPVPSPEQVAMSMQMLNQPPQQPGAPGAPDPTQVQNQPGAPVVPSAQADAQAGPGMPGPAPKLI